jgi:membrane-bound lytic murein transglycosylase D
MYKIGLIIFISCILCFSLPVFADEPVKQDAPAPPVISALRQDNVKGPEVSSDYEGHALANAAVNRNINLFSERIKERFSIWLSRSGKYLDLMKVILREKDVPEEIVFLPLIESGFSSHAYSPARAVGYWQFISSTAKRYGLEIDWWKDERRDPVKSTTAAASYLRDLYDMFGSWNLAMAAYNAGEGKILRALNKTNSDDYWSLLSTKYIRRETKDYVPKFIAASMIASNPEDFGFSNLEYYPPLDYDEVALNAPVDLDIAAGCAETTVEVIRELNPELRRWCTPPDVSEYILRIPSGKKDVFLENLALLPKDKRFSIDIYRVKKGETYKSIAKKTGMPLQVILDLNSIDKLMPLKDGMQIYLPPKDKLVLDRDDRAKIRKVSLKSKKNALSGRKTAARKSRKTGKV